MIRDATTEDIAGIVRLLMDFSKEVPVDCAQSIISPRIASNIALLAIDTGICKIVCVEGVEEPRGVAIGIVNRNIWSEHLRELQMLAIYVKPEYRNSITGGRLFKEYMKASDELISSNKVGVSIVYEQPTGTNINYKKLGFKPFQTQFIKEK